MTHFSFKPLLKLIAQILLLAGFWYIGSLLQKGFNLPFSASIIGLFLAFVSLMTGVIKLEWIKTGSDFILGQLVLFFIPCVVGLMKYQSLFLTEGWQLISAVVLGTVAVMLSTAWTVHLCLKCERWFKQRRKTHDAQVEQGASS